MSTLLRILEAAARHVPLLTSTIMTASKQGNQAADTAQVQNFVGAQP